MKVNITKEIRQEILDTLNRDTAKEYFEKLRDTEKNPTRGQVYAYRSWEQSTEDRADMFEVRALPWGSQIKDGVMKEFVAALTAADIDEIIVTDQSTALMESVHALVAEGAYLEGVGTVTRDPLHDPSGRREVKGLVFRLRERSADNEKADLFYFPRRLRHRPDPQNDDGRRAD